MGNCWWYPFSFRAYMFPSAPRDETQKDEINTSLRAPGLRADRFEKKRKGPCPGPAWKRASLETFWFSASKREVEREVFRKRRSKGGWDRRMRKEGKGRSNQRRMLRRQEVATGWTGRKPYIEQQARLSGLQIRGHLEPGDSLIDKAMTVDESDRLQYLEWQVYMSREHELLTSSMKEPRLSRVCFILVNASIGWGSKSLHGKWLEIATH